jgi:hypothetical protein
VVTSCRLVYRINLTYTRGGVAVRSDEWHLADKMRELHWALGFCPAYRQPVPPPGTGYRGARHGQCQHCLYRGARHGQCQHCLYRVQDTGSVSTVSTGCNTRAVSALSLQSARHGQCQHFLYSVQDTGRVSTVSTACKTRAVKALSLHR